MKLREIYNNNKTVISFEVFPQKDDEAKLLEEITILNKYNPAFISLTCGAGGKENKSFELLKDIQNLGINVMPHFTCITSSKKSVEEGLKEIENIGIENILALRGDIPENPELRRYDFNYANELVNYIKAKTNLSIGVAGYPEGHVESPDIKSDIINLKKKVEAGADAIFTQLFFDNNKFFEYIRLVRNEGINIPIIAGIMPIKSYKQIVKMTSLARVTIPENLQTKINKYKEDSKSMTELGIEYASKQCEELINNNVTGLHFFTLNKSYSTSQILNNIL